MNEPIKDASPDLLAALKDMLLAAEWADETGYVQDVGFLDIEAIYESARKAIAKAEGPYQQPEATLPEHKEVK